MFFTDNAAPDWSAGSLETNPMSSIYSPSVAWRWMMQSLQTPAKDELVREEVRSAWRRCLEDYQIRFDAPTPDTPSLPPLALSGPLQTRVQQIFELALDRVSPLLKEGAITLCIANDQGRLIAVIGRSMMEANPLGARLYGNHRDWSESVLGNNGIGTAILTGHPIAFAAEEHFVPALHPLTTAGAPIRLGSQEGPLVLGMVTEKRIPADFLLAINTLAAVSIESELLSARQSPPVTVPVSFRRSNAPKPIGLNPSNQSGCTDCGCHSAGDDQENTLERLVEKAILLQARKIPVLVVGESGAGKEYLIRSAVENGPRREGPFIALNCASIPRELIESELFGYAPGSFTGAKKEGKPGKFQLAHQGVLFLDEIGEMPLDLQAVLLRVLENSEFYPIGATRPVQVDVQIFAATNVPIQDAVRAGRFRQDLYYRLNGTQIFIPPLRDRPDKLRLIQGSYHKERELAGLDPKQPLSEGILELFLKHPWPGNVRQLKNVIRAGLAMSQNEHIRIDDLPESFYAEISEHLNEHAAPPLSHDASGHNPPLATGHKGAGLSMSDWNARAIITALTASQGNLSKTALLLGISRTTLYKKLAHFKIDPRAL